VADWDPEPILRWVLAEGRLLPTLDALVAELGPHLSAAGAPVWRMRISLRTVHPLVTAFGGLWERDTGAIAMNNVPHGLESRASYIGSPMERLSRTGGPLRLKLSEPLDEDDHPVLHDLKARGATDYYGLRLDFKDMGGAVFVLTADTPEGFSDHDLRGFRRLGEALAPVAQVYQLQHIAHAVSQTYLGPRAGLSVLEGRITRGHIETIRAAILISDLRGWTAINTRLPPEDTLALANRYFEAVDEAVSAQGGEILKLMGDGVLAIFPGEDAGQACTQALAAAQAALSRTGEIGCAFGVGPHYGQVLYGNIGARTRLDFTVLGAAVNLAARLEALCGELDRPLIASQAVAAALGWDHAPLALRRLKGLDAPQAAFAPPASLGA
jgi:adenylate cyclase